jgi:hypothetical protein
MASEKGRATGARPLGTIAALTQPAAPAGACRHAGQLHPWMSTVIGASKLPLASNFSSVIVPPSRVMK